MCRGDIANLGSLAGIVAPFSLPEGTSVRGGESGYRSCYFASTDLVAGSPSGSSQPYNLVLRTGA